MESSDVGMAPGAKVVRAGDERVSKLGYPFKIEENRWVISKNRTVSLAWTNDLMAASLAASFRRMLAIEAEKNSCSYAYNIAGRINHLFRWIDLNNVESNKIDWVVLSGYRSTLTEDKEHYLGSIVSFLKMWNQEDSASVTDCAVDYLSDIRLKGNEKGKAVALSDPRKGALTEIEFSALVQTLHDAYENSDICLSRYVLILLAMATARRAIQLSDLKVSDFSVRTGRDGIRSFFLSAPRAKQRGEVWRGSSKKLQLDPEIGIVISEFLDKERARFLQCGQLANGVNVSNLPFFIDWDKVASALVEDGFNLDVEGDCFHYSSPRLGRDLSASIDKLEVPSERVGVLHVTATRFRRTIATRAVRQGFGPLTIADILDHSDDQNARVYTENVPENVEILNEAVALQLAPFAQAFCGKLVLSEGDAERGNDPASRIRLESSDPAGSCGSYGFCSAAAPVACYTCKSFQPWLDGPHEILLQEMIKEKEKLSSLGVDPEVVRANDRSILAVAEVVKLCEEKMKKMKIGYE